MTSPLCLYMLGLYPLWTCPRHNCIMYQAIHKTLRETHIINTYILILIDNAYRQCNNHNVVINLSKCHFQLRMKIYNITITVNKRHERSIHFGLNSGDIALQLTYASPFCELAFGLMQNVSYKTWNGYSDKNYWIKIVYKSFD